jgi:hypothetical protein
VFSLSTFLLWLTNAGNVASVGTAGYEGYRAYKQKDIDGMAAVAIGAGVVVVISLLESYRQKAPLSTGATLAPTVPLSSTQVLVPAQVAT